MAKKPNKPQPLQTAADQTASIPQPEAPGSEAPALPQEQSAPPVSTAQILVFWGGVATALALAWALDKLLPGTPERIIERWIMGGFAAFLGVFLYKLK